MLRISPGTVRARYCWALRDVNGAKPGIKKCKRGNGTILTASLRKSAFNWPGKRRHVVTPDIVNDTKWFRSLYFGFGIFSVRKQMSYRASLSMQYVSSVFSTNWWIDSVALYGSTTISHEQKNIAKCVNTLRLNPHRWTHRYRRLSAMAPLNMYSLSGLGIPHEFWIWAMFPCHYLYHHRANASIESPSSNQLYDCT